MKLIAQNSLCESCRKLLIRHLLNDVNPEESGITARDHVKLEIWTPRGCGLCDFLMECLPARCRTRNADGTWPLHMDPMCHSDTDNPGRGIVWCYPPTKHQKSLGHLAIVVTNENTLREKSINTSPIVCVPSGRIQTYELEVLAPALNLALVVDWLKKEEDEEKEYIEQVRGYKENRSLSAALTVIDCGTCSLVSLVNKEPYATLSYIWGPTQPSSNDIDGAKMSLHLPDTIQDSIVVCKALDIKYLWVDR
jgi:hypothetical protein